MTYINIKKVLESYPVLTDYFKDKRVLILGGMGFLGSTTAHYLVNLGANVTIIDAMLPQYGGNKVNINGIDDELEFIKGDIRDTELLIKNVVDKDFIINYAAQVSHTYSMVDPYLDIDINCIGNLNILEAVRKYNDEVKLIYIGTRSQIGRMKYDPIDEDHPEYPTDIYSANKSVAEKYYLIYSSSYDIPVVSLRITNVYGPRAQVKSPSYGVVNYFIRLAIEGKTINVYEPGSQKRDLLYVDDAVNAVLLSCIHDKISGEVFNVASGSTHSLLEIVQKIVGLSEKGNWQLVPWPKKSKNIEVGDVSINIRKISEILNWQPLFTLEEGLKRTFSYYRACLEEYLVEEGR